MIHFFSTSLSNTSLAHHNDRMMDDALLPAPSSSEASSSSSLSTLRLTNKDSLQGGNPKQSFKHRRSSGQTVIFNDEEENKESKHKVAIIFVLFVILRAVDRVFNKRVQDRVANYQLMYMNVLWPVGVQLMTIVISVVFVYQKRANGDLRYDWTFFHPWSKIGTTSGAIYPQWKMGLFSFWDQLNAGE